MSSKTMVSKILKEIVPSQQEALIMVLSTLNDKPVSLTQELLKDLGYDVDRPLAKMKIDPIDLAIRLAEKAGQMPEINYK